MSDLQQILLTLSSILSQTLISQRTIWNILAKEVQGITPATREALAQLGQQEMERYKLLGEVSKLIANVN